MSFCSFAFSGTYKSKFFLRFPSMRANYTTKEMSTRTADFAIRVTRARGSSKFSIPSETASCCACADAGVLAVSFRGMAGSRIKVNSEMLTGYSVGRRDEGVESDFLFRALQKRNLPVLSVLISRCLCASALQHPCSLCLFHGLRQEYFSCSSNHLTRPSRADCSIYCHWLTFTSIVQFVLELNIRSRRTA